MSVVRINAITVPAEAGTELARRFAARSGAVDHAEGFEGFELLRPTDGRDTWLVVTHWRDDESFQAWRSSPAFAHGHRADGPQDGPQRPQGAGAVAATSELWSYDVVDLSGSGGSAEASGT